MIRDLVIPADGWHASRIGHPAMPASGSSGRATGVLRPARGRGMYPWLLAGSLGAVALAPLEIGRIASGIRDHSIGGLHVVNFVFFAGTSAAAVLIGVLAAASGHERWRPLARVAELTALAGGLVASMFLAMAIVAPGGTLVTRHTGLPLTWNGAFIAMYLGNAVALGYWVVRWDRLCPAAPVPRDDATLLRTLAIALAPAAVLFGAGPAWVFPVLAPDPGWKMLGTGALLYLSALVSGFALLVLAAIVGRTFFALSMPDDTVRRLATLLRVAVPVLGFCYVAEIQFMIEASGPGGGPPLHEIVRGRYAPVFWFAEIGGVVVPFLLLSFAGTARAGGASVAAALVVLGALAERWTLLVPPVLGHAPQVFTAGGYCPAGAEIVTTLLAWAAGGLACRSLARRLGIARR